MGVGRQGEVKIQAAGRTGLVPGARDVKSLFIFKVMGRLQPVDRSRRPLGRAEPGCCSLKGLGNTGEDHSWGVSG